MPTPPRPIANPGASSFGSSRLAPACFSREDKPAGADAVEQFDRGNIQRHLQRFAHRNRALESHVEILRRVGAEADRTVVDQAFRMNEAVLEGETIDERLQGRSRRAYRARHVDLTGTAIVEIIRRADPCEHVTAGVVDRKNGDGNIRT